MNISSAEKDCPIDCFVITAGSTYLDIDAYACSIAMKELLELKGEYAIAYSKAPYNYSVCDFLIEEGQMLKTLPSNFSEEEFKYIIVDVSDPDYIKDSVPLDKVVEVYDHHVGFEDYWNSRIGDKSHIEFIGAAATLIYRKWKQAGLQDKISRSTALLLIAAILDNTLNLTSSNTTEEDIEVFRELCRRENIGEEWCAGYFSEVQANVEADLRNALFNDLKVIQDNRILPPCFAQLCVWDAQHILNRLLEIRQWISDKPDSWMINVIDMKERCSYFICDDVYHQNQLEKVFNIHFETGVAKLPVSYLRKEIIKKAHFDK